MSYAWEFETFLLLDKYKHHGTKLHLILIRTQSRLIVLSLQRCRGIVCAKSGNSITLFSVVYVMFEFIKWNEFIPNETKGVLVNTANMSFIHSLDMGLNLTKCILPLCMKRQWQTWEEKANWETLSLQCGVILWKILQHHDTFINTYTCECVVQQAVFLWQLEFCSDSNLFELMNSFSLVYWHSSDKTSLINQ